VDLKFEVSGRRHITLMRRKNPSQSRLTPG
jgi:hypothetical protein